MKIRTIPALAMLLLAFAAQAQETGRGLFPRETRAIAREQRDLRLLEMRSLVADREQKVAVDVTAGLGYASLDGGGHSTNVPFELSATLPDAGKTNVRVSGDGYVWANSGGTRSDGFSDVEAVVSHAFFPAARNLRLGLGLKVGTGGEAGTRTDAAFVTASYLAPLTGQWVAAATVKAREDLNNVPAGSSRTVLSGGLQLRYQFESGGRVLDTFAQLVRGRRVHGTGSSLAIVGVDLGLAPAWTGTVQVARGLTAGSRNTGLEFDVTRSF
ncbi:MAG: hypothetical protein ACXWC6_14365 [Ramlibacter sp.]